MENTVEVVESQKHVKKKRKRINYALAGSLLAQGFGFDEIAVKVGAANGNTLRASLSRKGVSRKSVLSVKPLEPAVESLTCKVARQSAELIRESLGSELGKAVQALSSVSPRYKDLANQGQGHAAVLKSLAETHRTLYGGAETNVLVFGVGSMGDTPQPAIEVETVKNADNDDPTPQ